MYQIVPVFLALAMTIHSAEISSSYSLLEKHATFKPELKMEPVETHAVKEVQHESAHPVFRADEGQNQGRARIELVKSFGPVIRHDAMLSDQPAASTEVNRVNEMRNDYMPGIADVAYPDIPYAPGYSYDAGYPESNHYDLYGPNNYLMEPDTSTFGLLWNQVPDARTMASFVGRTFIWFFNGIFAVLIGSLLTVGVCTYTNLCTIAFNGIGPIHEEMRALITPERLEKISHAAKVVHNAIDKYKKIQEVTDATGMRRRRAIFNY